VLLSQILWLNKSNKLRFERMGYMLKNLFPDKVALLFMAIFISS